MERLAAYFVAGGLLGCTAHARLPASTAATAVEAAATSQQAPVAVEPEAVAVAEDTPAPLVTDDLAARAFAWAMKRRDGPFRFDPRVMKRKGWPGEAWVRDELVPAAIAAAEGARHPERWPDPELLLVKAWWESRWKPDAVGRFVVRNGRVVPGRGGELGVMQIKPRICARYMSPGEDCADTRVNLRVAATILRQHLATCEGRPRYALRFYGSGRGCAPPRRAEKTVFVWADQMRNIRPDPE